MQDRVVAFLKKNGPSTPIDVAKGLGINSMVASALLSDMRGKTVEASHKRFGSVRIYYLPEQAVDAKVKIFQSMEPREQEFTKRLKDKEVILEGEFPEEVIREYGDFLVEFDYEGKRAWHWFELSTNQALSRLKVRGKKPMKKGLALKPGLKIEPTEGLGYLEKAIRWLDSNQGVVYESKELKKNKEWMVVCGIPTPLGLQRYLVLIYDFKKKPLGIPDISRAYNKATNRRSPVILISSTGFAKSAQRFWEKEYKGIMTLVDGKNL